MSFEARVCTVESDHTPSAVLLPDGGLRATVTSVFFPFLYHQIIKLKKQQETIYLKN